MNTARHTPLKQLCPPDKTSIKPQGTQLPEKGWREGGGQGGRERKRGVWICFWLQGRSAVHPESADKPWLTPPLLQWRLSLCIPARRGSEPPTVVSEWTPEGREGGREGGRVEEYTMNGQLDTWKCRQTNYIAHTYDLLLLSCFPRV